MSSTTLQTFDLEALNSRSSTECQSIPRSGLKKVPISPLLLVIEVCNVKPTYTQIARLCRATAGPLAA